MSSDHELLRASRRDAGAFGVLAERYLPALRAWALAQTRDSSTANDVAAEALARAWLRRRSYRGSSDRSARAWLYGFARNVLREQQRHLRFRTRALARLGVVMPIADESTEAEECLASSFDHDDLVARVDELPLGQRDAVLLRVVDELPYREAAARLNRSEGATRLLVSRGLARLRRALPEVDE